jgi:hypothetical protein
MVNIQDRMFAAPATGSGKYGNAFFTAIHSSNFLVIVLLFKVLDSRFKANRLHRRIVDDSGATSIAFTQKRP